MVQIKLTLFISLSPMRLSVIIPAYNEYPLLIRLVHYLKNIPSAKDVEVIVTCSSLNTDETVFMDLCKVLLSPFHNRAAQMNFGVREATGDVLMFLHADVLPPETYYEDIKKATEKGFLFGFFAYRFQPSSLWLNINSFFTTKPGLFAGGGDQIHFMSRELFNKMGGYDETLAIMEDFDFVSRYKKIYSQYAIVKNKAVVSARKYHNRSWLRVNFANAVAFSMFLWKADAMKIKKTYETILG